MNDYVREGGVWKIATAHYFPQYDGPYEEGWINWGGGDLPVVPYHFDTTRPASPFRRRPAPHRRRRRRSPSSSSASTR